MYKIISKILGLISAIIFGYLTYVSLSNQSIFGVLIESDGVFVNIVIVLSIIFTVVSLIFLAYLFTNKINERRQFLFSIILLIVSFAFLSTTNFIALSKIHSLIIAN